MNSSKKKKMKIGQFFLHVFFSLLSLAYILPFILIISASFTDEQEIIAGGFSLIPKVFSTAAYELAFRDLEQLVDSYITTIIYSTVGTVLSMLIMSMMAYALARNNFKFRKPITFMVLFSMMFSGGMVPSYIINTRYLGLADNIWVYILPGLANAWNLIVLRSNFSGIPSSLFEAAKIDGASETRICFQIGFPLTVPAIAAVGFLGFVSRWNQWVTTSIYIRNPKLYSLQYLLQKILNEAEFLKQQMENAGGGSWMLEQQLENMPMEGYRFAMAILAAGPVLVIFPFFQKYFSKGLTVGSVKG